MSSSRNFEKKSVGPKDADTDMEMYCSMNE